MTKGVITIYLKERFVDRIAKGLYKLRLYKMDGYYPVIEDTTGKEVAGLFCIKGSKLIVRFLEYITDYRGKDSVTHYIEY